MLNILYILLAIFGLGFLVFIHELGHYIVAKRQKMKIETFAIGFGKPIFSWIRDGVRWQIGWLPFGGYVKIAGMQTEDGKDPYEIKDGFFSKSPFQRMKVALAGPIVNIVFALLVFSAIWVLGGREKPFSELTKKIGWVDVESEAFEKGIRPGDEITSLNNKKFSNFKDLLYSSVLKNPEINIEGEKIDYYKNESTPFAYTIKKYPDTRTQNQTSTIGILSPANYLLAGNSTELMDRSFVNCAPVKASGLENGDRFIWVDGELLFSFQQLQSLVNESTAFITIKRGDTVFHTKVPRVRVEDLQLSYLDSEELNDWKHETNISSMLSQMYVLPFGLTDQAVVEKPFSFIDAKEKNRFWNTCIRCDFFEPLKSGDQIIAIDGTAVSSSFDLLKELQTRKVLAIVSKSSTGPLSMNGVDQQFDRSLHAKEIETIVRSIGSKKPTTSLNQLTLLKPIVPIQRKDFDLGPLEIQEHLRQVESPETREAQKQILDKMKEQYVLGILMTEKMVVYNPSPFTLMKNAFQETIFTLSSLVTGNLNPKWLAGPVGIIHISHHGLTQGVTEALFWLGFISLNLGFMNLLPIPVLDGGYIVLSLLEMITRKRLKPKTMERLIIPFVVLLIGGLVYITYHDITRLITNFF